MAEPLRVLLVEDDEVVQQVVAGYLVDFDCVLDITADGAQAVAAVAETPYDIVLMDVHMPETDGIVATREIRSLPQPNASVPIIAVTADGSKLNRVACLSAGMNAFLTKPIDPAELVAAVTRFTGAPTPDVQWID